MATGQLTVGKVTTPCKIENLRDLYASQQGSLPIDQVRSIEVHDALVDTGATMLSLPKSIIDQLGLTRFGARTARTATGVFEFGLYSTVQLTIQGRDCRVDVSEVADDCPVLIGQVPLELLDWVVDPVNQRLIGNPDHGGKHMMDMF